MPHAIFHVAGDCNTTSCLCPACITGLFDEPVVKHSAYSQKTINCSTENSLADLLYPVFFYFKPNFQTFVGLFVFSC